MGNIAGANLVKIGWAAEGLVAMRLEEQGYHVSPARNHRYDLLCEGVRIEVKVASPVDGEWVWAFNGRKRFSDYCDIVILVGQEVVPDSFVYFILPADHPFFYNHDGRAKAGASFRFILRSKKCPRPSRRMLELHRDKWSVIHNMVQMARVGPTN